MKVNTLEFSTTELNAATGTTKVAYIEFTEPIISATGNFTYRQYGKTCKITNNSGAAVEVAIINRGEEEKFLEDPDEFGYVLINNGEVYTLKGQAEKIAARKQSSNTSSNLRIDIFHFNNPEEVE